MRCSETVQWDHGVKTFPSSLSISVLENLFFLRKFSLSQIVGFKTKMSEIWNTCSSSWSNILISKDSPCSRQHSWETFYIIMNGPFSLGCPPGSTVSPVTGECPFGCGAHHWPLPCRGRNRHAAACSAPLEKTLKSVETCFSEHQWKSSSLKPDWPLATLSLFTLMLFSRRWLLTQGSHLLVTCQHTL